MPLIPSFYRSYLANSSHQRESQLLGFSELAIVILRSPEVFQPESVAPSLRPFFY